MHRMESILFLLLAASLAAAGQEASSKAAAGQLSRTAASLSITSPLTAKQIASLCPTAELRRESRRDCLELGGL